METDSSNQTGKSDKTNENINLPGYPLYPDSEDVYSKFNEEQDLNPEDTSKMKEPNENFPPEKNNEKGFYDDVSGGDLDIPGNELDEREENMGSEDEENNFYSLGGDGHNDLEEDNG
jgi:hypothetical protein